MRGEWRLVRYRGYWCAYKRIGEKPVRRSFRTADKAVAEAKFAAFLAELNRRPEASTIGAVVDGYIESLTGHAKERQAMTLRAIKKVTNPDILSLRPDSLTEKHCQDYADARRRQGKSDGTIRADLGMLRSAFNWAKRTKWLAAVPYVELPPPPPAKDRWLTEDEARRLIHEAETPHLRLFIILALHTAARTAAILELTWDRVNDRFIDLNPRERVRTNKGRAVVPMNPALAEALSEARQGALSDYVIEWAGGPVGSIKKAFGRAAKRAGFDDVTPHTLRHTAATWMVQAGVPLAKVAAYLGHSNTRMVEQVYGHHAPDFLQDAGGAIVTRLHGVWSPGSSEPVGREQPAKAGRK